VEPIFAKLQEVLRTLETESRKWTKQLRTRARRIRTRTRKLQKSFRARLVQLDPRQQKRTKKGRFAKKPVIRPVPAAA
jgi:hypothetical protein